MSDAPDLEEAQQMSELASFADSSRTTKKCTIVNVLLATIFFIVLIVTLDGMKSTLADIDEETDATSEMMGVLSVTLDGMKSIVADIDGMKSTLADIDEETDATSEMIGKLGLGLATRLPGFEQHTWEDIEKAAMTKELNFYLWSPQGSPPRKWVDNVLRTRLAAELGIVLNRLDAAYSGCDIAGMKLVCDIRDEVAAGTAGTVDLVWINGVNFREMKNRNLLYGPFATRLPNAANFDFTDTAVAIDKGIPIGGYEFPFNQAQSVFLYNQAKVVTPPVTIPALWDFFQSNPGRFVYSNPTTDFTGSAFIRTAFYHFCGPWEDFLGPFNEELYLQRVPALWEALRQLEPLLYRPADAPWYPDTHEDIRALVGDETLWIDFSMSAFEAAQQQGKLTNPWPATMKAYLLETGTIADTNYLAIPVNAPNKEAALAAINYIGSAGAMFVRSTPEGWGTLQAFDPTADSIKEWDPAFDYILREESVPTEEELASKRLGDLHADYVRRLENDWVTFVRDYQMP